MRLLILAAVLPALLLIVYVYRKDGIEKEPTGLLVRLFLAGCLCCIPASVLESIFLGIAEGFFMDTALAFIEAFLVVAVAEEGCKLIALRLISWKNPAFNYTFDGIVYAVCVSLGFAALENVMYLSSYGLNLAVPRAALRAGACGVRGLHGRVLRQRKALRRPGGRCRRLAQHAPRVCRPRAAARLLRFLPDVRQRDIGAGFLRLCDRRRYRHSAGDPPLLQGRQPDRSARAFLREIIPVQSEYE